MRQYWGVATAAGYGDDDSGGLRTKRHRIHIELHLLPSAAPDQHVVAPPAKYQSPTKGDAACLAPATSASPAQPLAVPLASHDDDDNEMDDSLAEWMADYRRDAGAGPASDYSDDD